MFRENRLIGGLKLWFLYWFGGVFSPSFRGVSLSGADFSGMDLSKLDFRGANLSGANLRHCVLDETNLTDANLQGANLGFIVGINTLIENTDFRGANMEMARFFTGRNEKAFKSGDFRGANLHLAEFQFTNPEGVATVSRPEVRVGDVCYYGDRSWLLVSDDETYLTLLGAHGSIQLSSWARWTRLQKAPKSE